MKATPSPVSVVIPAHNEEAVIARCLSSLFAGAKDGELEVVVVCNGCEDSTAEVARQTAPGAAVLEIPVASKVAALNAGDRIAHNFPRFYLDADVELPIDALRTVAATLRQPGTLCAAPKPSFALEGRPWVTRSFYEVWQQTPYFKEGVGGGGVYGLSEEGRKRFGTFPDLTADDQFVRQLFEPAERCLVEEAHSVVYPPDKPSGLLAMRTRAYRGKRELAGSGLAREAAPQSGTGTALRLALRPRLVPAVGVYAAVNLLARGLARKPGSRQWERDESSRAGTRVHRAGIAQSGTSHELRICYVTSHYPALSHTFIMREVMGVRAAGLEVVTVSVHQSPAKDFLARADREEAARTWAILPLDLWAFAAAHLHALFRHSSAYRRTLRRAWSLAPPGARGHLWQLFYFAEAVYLWDHARRAEAYHLHAHLANVAADICLLASTFGKLAQPGMGWTWSFTMHGPTEFFSTEKFKLCQKVEDADAVICISEFTRAQLMYLSEPEHWKKLCIVHSGVELDRYVPSALPESPGLSVLCVARFVPAKGLELLVDAVGALRGRGADVRVTLVGEGPLGRSLRSRAERLGMAEHVVFPGPVGQDDMAGYYAECDVFCLPSFAEGVPVVLMEAMASGRPVVATRIAGIPELVEDGVSGLLVAPGSTEQLTRALERLAASRELRVRMGLAGRRKVEERFDSRRCAAQAADVFRALVASGGSRAT